MLKQLETKGQTNGFRPNSVQKNINFRFNCHSYQLVKGLIWQKKGQGPLRHFQGPLECLTI